MTDRVLCEEDIKEGKILRILYIDEFPEYTDKEGEVTFIDDSGKLHGTWGAMPLVPGLDMFQILEVGV